MSRHATPGAPASLAQGGPSSQGSSTTHLLISAVSTVPISSVPRLQAELTRASGSRAPRAFKQREIICTRLDDLARKAAEEEDGRWAQTRRARKEVKLRVLCESDNVTLMLPSPPPPARKAPGSGSGDSVATLRPLVILDLLSSRSESKFCDSSDGASDSGFSDGSEEPPEWHEDNAEWKAVVNGLGWSPERETWRTGIRFVLREQAPTSAWGASFEVLVFRVDNQDSVHDSNPTSYKVSARIIHPLLQEPRDGGVDGHGAAESASRELDRLQERLKGICTFQRDVDLE